MTRDEEETEELDDCTECGHPHFDWLNVVYVPCPQKAEGCTCMYVDGDGVDVDST